MGTSHSFYTKIKFAFGLVAFTTTGKIFEAFKLYDWFLDREEHCKVNDCNVLPKWEIVGKKVVD